MPKEPTDSNNHEPRTNPWIPFRLMEEAEPLPAPQERPLIVHVVINIECWPFDQPMPRTLLTAPHGQQPLPDIANFAWAEHGLRLGLPRIARILAERGITASAAMNAAVIDLYPQCAELAMRHGWEIIGHGVTQRSLAREDDQEAVIAHALDRVEAFAGRRPRGWLGPGFGETLETPHLLRQTGIDHLYDWMVDDIPCWMETRHGPMIAMPYALELNDVTIFAQERQPSPAFLERYRDAVEMIEPELATQPRILTFGLHPHIIGVPHRLKYLAAALDMLAARPDTIFMQSSGLADWFAQACPPPRGNHEA